MDLSTQSQAQTQENQLQRISKYEVTADIVIDEVYEINEEVRDIAKNSDATRHYYFEKSRMRYFHPKQITIGDDELFVFTANSKSSFIFVPPDVNRIVYVGEMMARIDKGTKQKDQEAVLSRATYASHMSFKRARIEGIRAVLAKCEESGAKGGEAEADEYIKELYSLITPPASPSEREE